MVYQAVSNFASDGGAGDSQEAEADLTGNGGRGKEDKLKRTTKDTKDHEEEVPSLGFVHLRVLCG